MMDLLEKMDALHEMVDAITSIVHEFVNPDTPDDREKCIKAITIALDRWKEYISDPPKMAIYITDVVETMAGGKDSVAHVLLDLDKFYASHNRPTPDYVHNFTRDFLDMAQKALSQFRSGKAMGG